MPSGKISQSSLNVLFKLYDIEHTKAMIDSEKWWASFQAKDYHDFRGQYPPGSDGYSHFENVCMFCELSAVMVKRKIVDEDLFFDVFLLGNYWEKARAIVDGMRAELHEPHLFENFELVYEIEQKWKRRYSPHLRRRSGA